MMKMHKAICLAMVMMSIMFLAACSGVSQSYADKINDAAEKEEYVTLEDARDKLGDNRVEILLFNTGILIGVKGVDSQEELEEKLDAGKTVKGIVITVFAGSCTSATYREIESNDLDD